MTRLDGLAFAEIHVHAARETRIEAPDRAHDIDALERVAAVLLEDWHVLNRVLVRARRAIDIPRARVPRRRRVRVVVGNPAIADDQMMRQHAADRFRESAPDAFFRHLEGLPGLGMSETDRLESLVDEINPTGRRIGLEIAARAIPFDGI